ncbi:hypothetical protein [Thalassospira profundimaris]|uniref:hypothetical protein n=1 Tax=Thalassospira profundimaris TaxID=502049 RepID=UPI000DEDC04F|nr:hypothetical protein [Thalassospira profundimaris]
MADHNADKYDRQIIDWRGYRIEIAYCRSWSPSFEDIYGYAMSHIEVRTIEPERAPLPITETGYRSHFIHEPVVAEHGGAEAVVRLMLEDAAKSREWRELEESSKQFSLF